MSNDQNQPDDAMKREQRPACKWENTGFYIFKTDCGERFDMAGLKFKSDDGLVEFCPFCGLRIATPEAPNPPRSAAAEPSD